MRLRSSPACCTKERILIEITGSTQGMTFRIMPAMNAMTSQSHRLRSMGSLWGAKSRNVTLA